ncbi:hypothetical protein [Psychrobacter sp. Rd 27.2]|uniref:hypothetical protein n=1 Tax=Psychrobacter sp. Rd 27.2 TaxID=1926479 RepID=UPI00117B251D|nr:hypothetical protein [Psychrobacter sp. Rd 27.2]
MNITIMKSYGQRFLYKSFVYLAATQAARHCEHEAKRWVNETKIATGLLSDCKWLSQMERIKTLSPTLVRLKIKNNR